MFGGCAVAEILVAEDDADVRKWLSVALETEGYAVRAVENGARALAAVRQARPDLVILDVMMPECDGFTACREIRRDDAALPVLMLTARDSEQDKITGLGLGADDYMTKPFSMAELFARVAALLRRGALTRAVQPAFRIGGCRIDAARLTLTGADGCETALAARECQLLALLASRRGEVLTRDRLLNELWGVTFYGNTRTLDQHVALVRRKLGADAAWIETVRNVGYRLRAEP